MIWWAFGLAFVAFCLAGWAIWIAHVALVANLQARQIVAQLLELATEAEAARATILEARTKDIEALRSNLDHVRRKYQEAIDLYQASLTIDGPLGSKRIQ